MTVTAIDPPPPSAARAFLALPAASSLVFLLSAASLLGGVWALLAPGMEDPERIADRFTAVGILHLYQLALLGVGWLLTRWRRGNHDAIGVALLIACFAIGTAAGLDTIAHDRPLTALWLGLASVPLLAAGGWWLTTRVLGRIEPSLAIAAGLLVAWHALAPGWLGWSFGVAIDDAARRDPQEEWASGLWLACAVAAALLPLATRFQPAWDHGEPFLRRAGMRWLLVLVLLLAGLLHLLLLDHAFTLERGMAAILPPLGLIVLVANELRRRTWGDAAAWDLAAVGLPVLAALIAAIASDEREGTWTPAVAVGCVALAACALGATRGRMLDLGLGATVVAVLVADAAGGVIGLRWGDALLATPVALAVLAVRRRRAELALVAVLLAAGAVILQPQVTVRLRELGVAPSALLSATMGAAVLAYGMLFPLTRRATQAGAWGLALGVYHAVWVRPGAGLLLPALAILAVALVLAGAAWRRRDPLLLAPLALPIASVLLRARIAWLGVGGAFALLGAGAWLSWRRLRHAGPDPHAPTELLPVVEEG